MYSGETTPDSKARHILWMIGSLLWLALAACSGPPAISTYVRVQQVQIIESDFQISASVTTFLPGVPYRFVIQNRGQIEHELMLMPASADTMNGMSLQRMDQMALLEVTHLAPGQSRIVEYTFPASTMGSHLQFACHYPGHYQAGMSLNITVASRYPDL